MLIITTILKILSINNERLEYNCLFTVAARAYRQAGHCTIFCTLDLTKILLTINIINLRYV